MSIATEITRLQNAKSALATSIEGKGVTVPSSTKLDGYAALVDSIQTGGGGGSVTIEGHFKDAGIRVVCVGSNSQQYTTTTDSNGDYSITLPDDTYNVYFLVDFNEDSAVKNIFVTNWGGTTGGNTHIEGIAGEITYEQMKSIAYVGNLLQGNTQMVDMDCLRLTSLLTLAVNDSSGAFYNCNSLRKITLPATLAQAWGTVFGIANAANTDKRLFYNCTSLIDVTIEEGIQAIGYDWFWNCTSLTTITLPSTLTTIRGYAFEGCTRLAKIVCLPTTPPTLDSTNAFSGMPASYKIYVPDASLSAYQSATNWSNVSSHLDVISNLS